MRRKWARPGEALARRGVSGGTRRKVGADAVHIAEIDDEVDRVRPRAVDGHDRGAVRAGVASGLVKADFPQQAVRALRRERSLLFPRRQDTLIPTISSFHAVPDGKRAG